MSPPHRPPRALTLDLWHTLVYLTPEAEEAYMREQTALGTRILLAAPPAPGAGAVTEEAARAAFEKVYAEAIVASQRGESVSPGRQIVRAGELLGRRPDPAAYAAGLEELVARTSFLEAPGARSVLRSLVSDGWSLGLISNTVGEPGRTLRPVLERYGLSELLGAVVFSDEERWTKPAPEIFDVALARLGVSAHQTVHVGDGWVDIEGARRAGLRAGILFTGLQHYGERYRRLFLPEGWANPETPFRFERWEELPALLERLE